MTPSFEEDIVLDLCGGTGAWGRPWAEAGYDVRVITLPEHDVRDYKLPKRERKRVYCILVAPPCTYFCRMRMCRGLPTREELREGLEVVGACMKIIWEVVPEVWALENPAGLLRRWIGEPRLKFNPWEYGDPWTKRTWIWGKFSIPPKFFPAAPQGQLVTNGKRQYPSYVNRHTPNGQKGIAAHNNKARSITPPGFAKAFFEANHRINSNT